MPTEHHRALSVLPRPTLKSIVRVPLRPQTYRNVLYLLLAFPLGLVYFVFLAVGLSVGIGLTVTVIGIPIVLAVLAIALGLGSVERKLTMLILGIDITPPQNSPLSLAEPRPLTDRLKALVIGRETWKSVVYLVTKLVFGLASFALIMSLLVTGVTLLLVPVVYDLPGVYVGVLLEQPTTFQSDVTYGWSNLLVGVRGIVELTSWQVTTLPEALAVAILGVVVIILSLNVLNWFAWLSGWYAQFMLGDSTTGKFPTDVA